MDNCTSTRNNHSCKFVCKVGKKSREQSSNVLLNLHASELYVTKELTKMVITKINFLFEIHWPKNIFFVGQLPHLSSKKFHCLSVSNLKTFSLTSWNNFLHLFFRTQKFTRWNTIHTKDKNGAIPSNYHAIQNWGIWRQRTNNDLPNIR